jgi:hypothetical protein
MRLVSLWWELPPWLDSNSNIWFREVQEFLYEILNLFLKVSVYRDFGTGR